MRTPFALRQDRQQTKALPDAPALTGGKTRVLAGITVIDTPLITRAMEYARANSEPFLFNHAVRSWLFAARLGQLQGIAHDAEVVAVSSLLHDLGLTDSFTGPQALRDRRSRRRARVRPRGGAGGSPGSIDLGQRGLEFHSFDRPVQGNGRGALHGRHRSRLRRTAIRPHPAGRDEGCPRSISPPRHEAGFHRCGLPHRQDQAGDHLRQLRARLRRAFRAGLQAAVQRGLSDEWAVRGVDGPNAHKSGRRPERCLSGTPCAKGARVLITRSIHGQIDFAAVPSVA